MRLRKKRLVVSAGLTIIGAGLFMFANMIHGQVGGTINFTVGISGSVGLLCLVLALLAFLSAILEDG